MFEAIIQNIENSKFDEATEELKQLLQSDKPKIVAIANYLLGYINTCRANQKRNEYSARKYLLNNINSDFPNANAYVLFSKTEEDANIAEGYLKKGLAKFPNEPRILLELLNRVLHKEEVIAKIVDEGITDFNLLSKVAECLIENGKWGDINRIIFRIQSNHSLNEIDNAYLDLLKAYSYLFGTTTDYEAAICLLEKVADTDIDNRLGYSHFLGIIYASIQCGKIKKAEQYFDKLPVNNAITDLDDAPCYFIPVRFDREYKEIFGRVQEAFALDEDRTRKAKCLYSLYLYKPYPSYGIMRFNETDRENVECYFEKHYNKVVAAVLFDMACYFADYRKANVVYLRAISEGNDLDRQDVYYSSLTDKADIEMLLAIVDDTVAYIQNTEPFYIKIFLQNAFENISKVLHEHQQYAAIVKIAELFTAKDLAEYECNFYCAYAYAQLKSDKGFEIYSLMLQNEPNNTSVLNNIGVIYESRGDLDNALVCFQKAYTISQEELHCRNFNRVKQKVEKRQQEQQAEKQKSIRAMVKDVSLSYFESIGYNSAFVAKFDLIQEEAYRRIIIRDLQECVTAIAAKQDKTATIMMGSIIEALLFAKISEAGFIKYPIPHGQNTKNDPVQNMALKELLYVAKTEKMISERFYKLSDYIRDYRNIVHPAREVKDKTQISHENVLITWSILKQLVDEILCEKR